MGDGGTSAGRSRVKPATATGGPQQRLTPVRGHGGPRPAAATGGPAHLSLVEVRDDSGQRVHDRPAHDRPAHDRTAGDRTVHTRTVRSRADRLPVESSPQVRARRRRLALALADGATVVVALAIVVMWLGSPRPTTTGLEIVLEAGAIAAVWMSALVANRVYLARCVERAGEEVRRILIAGAVTMAAYLVVVYLVGAALAERPWVIGAFVAVSTGLVAERSAARRVFRNLRRRGRSVRRIAIIGSDAHALALHASVVDDRDAYDVAGLIGDPGDAPADVRVLGGYDRVVDILREHDCSGAIVSLASLSRTQVNAVVRALSDAKMHVALSTSMRDIDVHRLRAQQMDGEVLMYVEPTVRTGWRMSAKRTFDVVLSAIALLLCLPVLAVIAVLIKLDSPGPVLFRQQRIGRDGSAFDMVKLRTMCVDAEARRDELRELNEANGPLFKIKADPRVTRIGRFLRRFSIDEIPQFWNVIRGDMSLVGPRPALEHEVATWDPELRKRLEVPPGLSGLWQVSGRSDATFEQYRRLDLYYVDNWSLSHDLRVIVKTVWVVLTMKGAS